MIGRVLQECAPYFLLLFGITTVFGLAMRVAFVQFQEEEASSEDSQESYWAPPPCPSSSGMNVSDVEKVYYKFSENLLVTCVTQGLTRKMKVELTQVLEVFTVPC